MVPMGPIGATMGPIGTPMWPLGTPMEPHWAPNGAPIGPRGAHGRAGSVRTGPATPRVCLLGYISSRVYLMFVDCSVKNVFFHYVS